MTVLDRAAANGSPGAGVQPHFLAPKASAYIRELATHIIARPKATVQAITGHDMLWIADAIDAAVKFVLPPEGRLLAIDPGRIARDLPIEIIRPPFPITVAEYVNPIGVPMSPRAGFLSARRIVLMLDLARVDVPMLAPEAAARVRQHGGTGMIAVFESEAAVGPAGEAVRMRSGNHGDWHIAPAMAVIAHDPAVLRSDGPSPEELEAMMQDIQYSSSVTGAPPHGSVLSFMVNYAIVLRGLDLLAISRGRSFDEVMADLRADCVDELRVALDFCMSLACKNIDAFDVPASPALNRKRARNGKPPLPDYKVLGVKLDPARPAARDAGDHSGRESPRQHFRRGHIRRLHDGALTWVSPAVVGLSGAGVVNKDYRLFV